MKIPGLKWLLFCIGILGMATTYSVAAAEKQQRQEGKDFTDLKSQTTIYPKWFKDSFWDLNDDIVEANRAGKTGIMIYTSTKTCSYCIAFIEKSLGDPVIQRRLRSQFDVLGLEVISDGEITDVDGKNYSVKNFLKKYKAYFTPTLLFFGKDGKLLLSIAGYYPPEKFTHVLDYLEGAYYQKETWRQYFARVRTAAGTNHAGIIRDKDLFLFSGTSLQRHDNATRPLLVLFETPDCAACREMHERVLVVETTRSWIRRFDAIQLDASDSKSVITTPSGNKTTAAAWADKLDLAYFPSFVFFDESGAEVFRIDTYTRNVRLEGTLELVLTKGYKDEPQLQRWRRQQFVKEQAAKVK